MAIDKTYYLMSNGSFLYCNGQWENGGTFPRRADAHHGPVSSILKTIELYRNVYPSRPVMILELRELATEQGGAVMELGLFEVPFADIQKLAQQELVDRVLAKLSVEELNAIHSHFRRLDK